MTRLPPPTAAVLSLLLGAGCSLVPRYERPTPPVPLQWDADAGGAPGPSDVPARYRRSWPSRSRTTGTSGSPR
jgi:hypothetical protein